jgi:hypothetical protein
MSIIPDKSGPYEAYQKSFHRGHRRHIYADNRKYSSLFIKAPGNIKADVPIVQILVLTAKVLSHVPVTRCHLLVRSGPPGTALQGTG